MLVLLTLIISLFLNTTGANSLAEKFNMIIPHRGIDFHWRVNEMVRIFAFQQCVSNLNSRLNTEAVEVVDSQLCSERIESLLPDL